MAFIDNNPETIIKQSVSKYNEIAQTQLSSADVEMLIINIMAYRESLLRGSMERAMRANFVQTAEGEALDYWGALFGINRLPNQNDDDYRTQILNQNKLEAVGTRAAYTTQIKSLSNVADVLLFSKQDDTTLPPGAVKIVAIEKQTLQNGISFGIVANQGLKDSISNILSDIKTNLIGDIFIYEDAIAVPIDGTVQVRKNLGVTYADILNSVQYRVDNYFGNLSQKFNSIFGNFDLERELLQATGIKDVANLSFVNVPILRKKQFFVKGNITISII